MLLAKVSVLEYTMRGFRLPSLKINYGGMQLKKEAYEDILKNEMDFFQWFIFLMNSVVDQVKQFIESVLIITLGNNMWNKTSFLILKFNHKSNHLWGSDIKSRALLNIFKLNACKTRFPFRTDQDFLFSLSF